MRLYVHGGVSGRTRPARDLTFAVDAARESSSAVGAVEAAICKLEDDPELNAGYGAVLNVAGELELDAGIADGSTGALGAVAGVAVRNPIRLARAVLERTQHVLMAGPGATRFAAEIGLEPLEDTTPEQRSWRAATSGGPGGGQSFGGADQVDTVGAVALDDGGRLCAGSSTGGVTGQMPGRVGDSPLFGAGFYASRKAAVTGTGVGELFIETLASLRAGHLIENGVAPQQACESVIAMLGERRGDAAAGLLALDDGGGVGAAYRGGSWFVAGPEGMVDAVRIASVS
ncbi:MAG TPA: isoaspartyl peptidase/L-asparaginase [Actinomycetota bacterium]|nr:isoaspartyl peptidase/L-asparaginase [Actinomycetota bacterium]